MDCPKFRSILNVSSSVIGRKKSECKLFQLGLDQTRSSPSLVDFLLSLSFFVTVSLLFVSLSLSLSSLSPSLYLSLLSLLTLSHSRTHNKTKV